VSTPTDLSETIAEEAALPVSSSSDGQSSTGRSIADLIAADTYLAAKAARKNAARGVMFSKLIPPGPMPDETTPTPFGGGVCG